MQRKDKLIFLGIIILTAFAVALLLWPAMGRLFDREDMKLGLDLEGGLHLVYEADLSGLTAEDDPDEIMNGVLEVIERRVNAYGVSEAIVQRAGDKRIMVELPGIENEEEAKRLIGETALIRYMEQETDESGNTVTDENGEPVWIPATGILTIVNEAGEEEKVTRELTSRYLKGRVFVNLDPQTNAPEIEFEWNAEGSKLFEQITTRLLHKPLGIFLGGELQSAPIVQSVITDKGVITGMELEKAKRLASLLNAGRIDVPLERLYSLNIDTALGDEFIDLSLLAGGIGLGLVILFMALYYRASGVMAGIALLIYAALVLAAFKLIPVTLTLAGIAGFILSVGMAVDANVLIFERMREEIRMGRTIRAAVEVGFNRAWPAIRDSNISTFITCGILYWMGNTLAVPQVMGFALTLLIGVAISMFSAIVITKTLLRLLTGTGAGKKVSFYMPPASGKMLSTEGY